MFFITDSLYRKNRFEESAILSNIELGLFGFVFSEPKIAFFS